MRSLQTAVLLSVIFLTAAAISPAGELPTNQWVQLKDADIGQRACGALVYSPEAGRFLVLGGGLAWNAKGDQPYGDLALDLAEGKWENWYPTGKSFGPKFGPCQPPKFKEYYGNVFADVEGTNRVNPNAHMWRWIYGLCAREPDAKKFYFHGGGATWSYDPAARKWEGIETTTHPAKAGVGPLLWSSMCYDAERKRFVLFGGGNVQSERGDAGTWLFDPAAKQWAELKLDKQPPASQLAAGLRPGRQEGRALRRRRAGRAFRRYLDLRRPEVGGAEAGALALAARRPRHALAAQGQAAGAPGRLRL